jgi:hypothetical protein
VGKTKKKTNKQTNKQTLFWISRISGKKNSKSFNRKTEE